MSDKKYTDKEQAFRQKALDYHIRLGKPGKVEVVPTKPLSTQQDLALAYSPGVAVPCEEIAADPLKAYDYTAKGNLVAVISEGTAVLGLGNIGALASKPVMEGKSVLFKKFANIDSVDVEIDMGTQMQLPADSDEAREEYITKFCDIVASLEPTYGGINLEDIKAPECFEIEQRLIKRMNIPVFHDDQHGTAIIVTAAFTNWLKVSGRDPSKLRLVASGAGASAISCLKLLQSAGLKKENIIVCDRNGVVYEGRNDGMDPQKAQFAAKTKFREIGEAMVGADIFLGLSGPKAITGDMVKSMADKPLIMTLANPTPEIMPEETMKAKPDAIICTGRSDYPNQVNNVLCFPFLFRGALDVGATEINEEMKLACVNAIAELARKEVSPEVAAVYRDENLTFGPDYMIPKPFDPRLIVDLPIAVAKAAMKTGVAKRPIEDFAAYEKKLKQFFIRSHLVMQPLLEKAKKDPKRVVYCEGEEERVLQAVQSIVDDNIAKPILIGRKRVIEMRIEKCGLRLKAGTDFELCDPEDDPRYKDYWQTYYDLMNRRGVTPADAKTRVRTDNTVIGALMVYRGEADGLICGTTGHYNDHKCDVMDIIGLKEGVEISAAMNALVLDKGTLFFTDTEVNVNPDAGELADITMLAVDEIKRFGITPKIAMLSHSNYGTNNSQSARKMREAYLDVQARDKSLQVDGEMHADVALSEEIRKIAMTDGNFKGGANLMVMPNIESANIAYNMVKVIGNGITIGPILLGVAKPAHILTPAVTPRGIMNMTAYTVVAAQD